MVASGEKLQHEGTPLTLQETEAGRAFSWELGVRRLWKPCAAKCETLDAGYGSHRSGESGRTVGCRIAGLPAGQFPAGLMDVGEATSEIFNSSPSLVRLGR